MLTRALLVGSLICRSARGCRIRWLTRGGRFCQLADQFQRAPPTGYASPTANDGVRNMYSEDRALTHHLHMQIMDNCMVESDPRRYPPRDHSGGEQILLK